MKPSSNNIVWHDSTVSEAERRQVLSQKGVVLWFSGLSGSGKSTIARALEKRLLQNNKAAFVLDGDNLRHGLNADLGFSQDDRAENIRRVAEVAALMADAGLIIITAFISPYAKHRAQAASIVNRADPDKDGPVDRFIEVFINTPLDVCEARDPKALYNKARKGLIKDFTGISAPFEPPQAPNLTVCTTEKSVEECVQEILHVLTERGIMEGKTND